MFFAFTMRLFHAERLEKARSHSDFASIIPNGVQNTEAEVPDVQPMV